jgi:chromosome segregation ATPase
MTDSFVSNSEITPEKLTIMKLKASGIRDVFSEPSSPTGLRQSFSFGSQANGISSSSSTARRSSRQVSSSRRASTFRSKMSSELTSQAEGKFFALMDLMSTASREASSLKESWARIMSERDALVRERDELLVTVEEVTEEIQRKETEYSHHGHEHGERKRQIEKLILELTAAMTTVTEHKKKLADRDRDLEHTRTELVELQSSMSLTHGDHERTRTELEATYAKLRACEGERDSARSDSDKHHGELRTLLREHTELKSKHTETASKFESTRKELLTLTDRIKMFEIEREEHLQEKDRLQDDLKRTKLRAEETSRDHIDLTERHDRVQRDHHKLKEAVRVIETERDDHALTIENLRREVKAKAIGWEESDTRCNEFSLKYEHIKREVVSVKEKLRDVELERTELRDAIDRSREDHRLIVVERDQLKEDLHDEHRKVEDGHRRIHLLEDSLRRAELTITEIKSEVHTLTERNKVLIRDGEDSRGQHGHLTREITALQEKLAIFQAEIRNLTHARDRAHADLDAWKHKYEEVTETISTYDDSSAEFEFEIESLRTLLREAREQKERAINARHTADRERDEYVAKYEEKCREMERFEESASSVYHAHSAGRGGGGARSSTTRVVSSGTTIHNAMSGHGHSHGHTHGDGSSPFTES